ncbi:MAG: phosphate ABC transporter substrate-binding protein [Ardenticatenales bacterium]|nr:phosphate ABC transporter substrate-binding protein [Ardenticatenales bacterium]
MLIWAALLVACAQPAPEEAILPVAASPTPEALVIRVTGSHTMEPLLRELARTYMRENTSVIIEVSGGGSRWAIEALHSGQAEIGMVSRPLDTSERADAAGNVVLVETPIARDGLALIVHPGNPINKMERAQLASIFAGDLFLWDDMGWLAGQIQVVSREAGSGDRAVMEALLLPEGRPLSLNAVLMPEPAAVVAYVAKEPDALGYVSLAQLSSVVKVLRVDNVTPSLETVASGEYPFARDLLLVTLGSPEGEVQRFMAWVLGPEGQRIVARRYLPMQ